MARGFVARLGAIWKSITGRGLGGAVAVSAPAEVNERVVDPTGPRVEAGVDAMSQVVPSPGANPASTTTLASDDRLTDSVAKYTRSRRDFRLADRIGATSRLNRPSGRRNDDNRTSGTLVGRSRADGRKPKILPPRRHVRLVAKPVLPAYTGDVIWLPTAAERAARLARAA